MHFFVYMLYLSKNDLWINRDFFYILEVSYFCLHWLYQEFIGNGLQHTGSFSWLLMTWAFQGDESGRLNYTQLPLSLASLFFWTFTFTHFRKLFNIHNHSLGKKKKKKILPLTSLIQCHYTTTFFFFCTCVFMWPNEELHVFGNTWRTHSLEAPVFHFVSVILVNYRKMVLPAERKVAVSS